MKLDKNLTLLRLTYFVAFFADALFTPFIALYFLSVGLTSKECGILLSIVPFATFFGNYFCSFFAKRFRRGLFLLHCLSLFEGIAVLIIGFTSQFCGILVLLILFSFNNSSYFQIQDAYAAVETKNKGSSFYSVRIFGSLAYACALLLGFFLIKGLSYKNLFILSSSFFFFDFAMTFFLTSESNPAIVVRPNENLERTLKSLPFVFYLVFYVLIYGSLSIGSYVLPIHLKNLGLADNEYSAFNALRVGCEIVMVLFSARLYKWMRGYRNCLIVASSLFILSSLSVAIFNEPYLIVTTNYMMRGIGGGLFIVASVGYVQAWVGDSMLGKALTIVAGSMNVFTGIGNLVSPYLYDSLSFNALFGILACIQVVGLLFMR